MLTKRIIACLDVRSGRVVKGVQFVDLVDAGDPAELARRHAEVKSLVLLSESTDRAGRPMSTPSVEPSPGSGSTRPLPWRAWTKR